MNAFLEGLGKIFGKIADNTQGRIERLKNEKETLNNEKRQILFSGHALTGRELDRVLKIDKRLGEIRTILANSAKD